MNKKSSAKQKIISALAKTEDYLKNMSKVDDLEYENPNNEDVFDEEVENKDDVNDLQKTDENKLDVNDSLSDNAGNDMKKSDDLLKELSEDIKENKAVNNSVEELLKDEDEIKKNDENLNIKANKDVSQTSEEKGIKESETKENKRLEETESKKQDSTNKDNNDKIDLSKIEIKEENNSSNQTASEDRYKEDTVETSINLDKDKKDETSDINQQEIGLLSHEKFVELVKNNPDLKSKIILMGKRISYLNTENDRLNINNSELKTKSLNLMSKFENERKILEEDKERYKKNSLKGFLKDIIGTIDIFEMALNVKTDSQELLTWLKGFEMIYKNLFSVLESQGVSKIVTNPGDDPDYNFHNVIEIVATNEVEEGKIYQIRQQGFMFNGQLLRAASVTVAKPLEASEAKEKSAKDKDKKEDKSAKSKTDKKDANANKTSNNQVKDAANKKTPSKDNKAKNATKNNNSKGPNKKGTANNSQKKQFSNERQTKSSKKKK